MRKRTVDAPSSDQRFGDRSGYRAVCPRSPVAFLRPFTNLRYYRPQLAAHTAGARAEDMERTAQGMVVTVCGGGNAAHVAAGMYSHRGATVNMFLSDQRELQQWQQHMKDGIEVQRRYEGDAYMGQVSAVSAEPADVIPQSDMVLIIVPAFAHRPILTAIGPHLKKGAMLLTMPAPGNFDMLAGQVLGPKVDDVALAGTVCLPWACRIVEYARKVELLGEKNPVTLVGRPASAAQQIIAAADKLHDATRFRAEQLFVQATLFPTNPMLHPGIMYAFWSRWNGQPLEQRPMFYEGVDDYAASVLEGEDQDLQAIRRALEQELGMVLELPTLKQQMVEGYGDQISDPSTYKSMLNTNASLMGLYHPSVQDSDGNWLPDLKSRYLWEDVPHGLVAMKGVAQLMSVPTPSIDKVLTWAQGMMGREYLVGDQLVGKDLASTAAPQAFGITTKEALLNELRHQLAAPTAPAVASA